MKLGKIKKAFGKPERLFAITDANGDEWVSDTHATYAISKAIGLNKDNMVAIFDYDVKDQDEIYTGEIRNAEHMPWLTIYPLPGDEELRPVISVSWRGELVTIFLTGSGEAVMIPESQIKAAEDRALAFFLRRYINTLTGEVMPPVVACFADMTCCALIAPYKAETARDIWQAMRDASSEALRYCVEMKEETE